MKTVLRAIVGVIAVGVLVLLAFSIYARSHDGPLEMLAGGPFESGDWVESAGVDWSFLTDTETIQFQLLEPARSRTVWVTYHEGKAFIPCGVPNFRLWKQWPNEALKDGRAVLRIDGKRYPVNVVKTDDPVERKAVFSELARKYGSAPPDDGSLDDLVWVFRIEPRERSGAEAGEAT